MRFGCHGYAVQQQPEDPDSPGNQLGAGFVKFQLHLEPHRCALPVAVHAFLTLDQTGSWLEMQMSLAAPGTQVALDLTAQDGGSLHTGQDLTISGPLVRDRRSAKSNPNITGAAPGIELFSNGTCDVLVTASPLSESQAAPLIRRAPAPSALICFTQLLMCEDTCSVVYISLWSPSLVSNDRLYRGAACSLQQHVSSKSFVWNCVRRQTCCRGLNRTILEVPVAVVARKFVHSWQPWSESLCLRTICSVATLHGI